MLDRRRFPRTNVFKGAKIIAPGQDKVACIVRNISRCGAGVQLSGGVHVPADFDLCFDTGRRFQHCRIVWRTQSEAGIEFEPQA